MREVFVHLLPDLVAPDSLAGTVCVVIDVLRATTTICHATTNGADALIPCETIDEARSLRESDGEVLLGGERGGKKIEGFDLGNSPAEYDAATVSGRRIAFTTTNGTRALLRCSAAEDVLIACFNNFTAVLRQVIEDSRPIHLVCAGTDGQITSEDTLLAGTFAASLDYKLSDGGKGAVVLNDAAQVAIGHGAAIRNSIAGSEKLAAYRKALRESQGGKNLIAIGLEDDIETAANWDLLSVVPRYDSAAHRITG